MAGGLWDWGRARFRPPFVAVLAILMGKRGGINGVLDFLRRARSHAPSAVSPFMALVWWMSFISCCRRKGVDAGRGEGEGGDTLLG